MICLQNIQYFRHLLRYEDFKPHFGKATAHGSHKSVFHNYSHSETLKDFRVFSCLHSKGEYKNFSRKGGGEGGHIFFFSGEGLTCWPLTKRSCLLTTSLCFPVYVHPCCSKFYLTTGSLYQFAALWMLCKQNWSREPFVK